MGANESSQSLKGQESSQSLKDSESSQSLKEYSFSLKVLLEKKKNRVVFVESNKDFVDVLFSFMTLPIGTIIRLAREQSPKVEIGCLNNIYESIVNLDEEHLRNMKCKDMLLHPRSAAEIYCRNLTLNFNHSDTNEYYTCSSCTWPSDLSPYQTPCFHCGETMSTEVKLCISNSGEGVFAKPNAQFIITDDFQILPMSTITGLTLLRKFGSVDGSKIEERTINIGKDEVLKLLMCSITSRSPFSETFLKPAVYTSRSTICRENFSTRSTNQSQRAMDTTKKDSKITLKLIINKSTNRALYVEARKDFVDLISSFLTFPLGYVFNEFPCLSLRGCLGKLYRSIEDLDVGESLKSEKIKSTLINPNLAKGLAYDKQLIRIREVLYRSYLVSYASWHFYSDSKSHQGEAIAGEGFMRGTSKFMVTDDLTVTPLSIISGISLINGLDIPLGDILEREVTVGEEEALHLLEAAFVSKTVLTDVFILKGSKQNLKEKSDN